MNAETRMMERVLGERACERLILTFARNLDFGNPSSIADLFTPYGTWEWPASDRRVTGRDALREYFGRLPADRLSRHICTNILVTVTPPDMAAATTYFTTYRVDDHSEGMVSPQPPAQVGHYVDTFRKVDGTWLFATRTTFLSFADSTDHLDDPGQP